MSSASYLNLGRSQNDVLGNADDHFKFDENGRKLSKWVENTVTSNFSFSHGVFKTLVSQGRQKVSLCGNTLNQYFCLQMELNTLSLEAMTLLGQKLDFERLEVNVDLAMEMFEDNHFKIAQIPYIAAADSQGRVTVYRIGNFVDISQGPLVANTSQIGRFTITKVIILGNQILKEFHRIVPWVTLFKKLFMKF